MSDCLGMDLHHPNNSKRKSKGANNVRCVNEKPLKKFPTIGKALKVANPQKRLHKKTNNINDPKLIERKNFEDKTKQLVNEVI